MSDLNIRRALATLLNTAGIPNELIAWENTTFDPTGLDYYVKFDFFPAVDAGFGRADSGVIQDGFSQVSVFTKLNSGDYGTLYLQTIDTVKSAFSFGAVSSYNDQSIRVTGTTNINPSESESWYQGGLTVNYQAIKGA